MTCPRCGQCLCEGSYKESRSFVEGGGPVSPDTDAGYMFGGTENEHVVIELKEDTTMEINIPRSLRLVLYVVVFLGGPLVAYFNSTGVLGENEIVLWATFTSAIAALAGFNITPQGISRDGSREVDNG